ncbi:hypothetical protein EVAR_77202_1 [Eumeta japonica]|uniref:Uncharacterized protein n=1 Tax=Eumeta variegata TaxID=151549 RepID=A0A4C1T306_EUMVA|nr:hypothetical protein EVAR_77202_1 [Eumeta japonica]
MSQVSRMRERPVESTSRTHRKFDRGRPIITYCNTVLTGQSILHDFTVRMCLLRCHMQHAQRHHEDITVAMRIGRTAKEELKLPTLIAIIEYETYELLVNLALEDACGIDYEQADQRQHLQPTPSPLAERYHF